MFEQCVADPAASRGTWGVLTTHRLSECGPRAEDHVHQHARIPQGDRAGGAKVFARHDADCRSAIGHHGNVFGLVVLIPAPTTRAMRTGDTLHSQA